jgi:glutamine synthetase
MCFVYEGGIVTGKGFRRCPRSRLQEITNTAKKEHDIDFLIGIEIEFFIFDDSNGTPEQLPIAPNPWTAASLNNMYTAMIDEIVHWITKISIDVRQIHSEGSPGCLEISLEPLASPGRRCTNLLRGSHQEHLSTTWITRNFLPQAV